MARLFTDGSFQKQLDAEFEGDYRLEWHAAPPRVPILDRFIDRRDARTGRTRKSSVGPWAFKGLRLLARLKFLRGTPLDLTGRTEHRQLERRLIGEYERNIELILAGLDSSNHELAVRIARLPEHVRGFEAVKEEQLAAVREDEAELLQRFRADSGGSAS